MCTASCQASLGPAATPNIGKTCWKAHAHGGNEAKREREKERKRRQLEKVMVFESPEIDS